MTKPTTSCVVRHSVEVDLEASTSTLYLDGRAILLTPTQFLIVAYLVGRSAHWVTAAEIIEHVLHTHHEPDTALIRVHVHAIRRRLGGAASYLQGDRRFWRGYRWSTQLQQQSATKGDPARGSARFRQP
jgi:DNA-binding response OmpR family regulator